MKKIFIIVFCLFQFKGYSQIPPYDKNWVSDFTDDFISSPSLTGSGWTVRDNFDHYGEPQVYRDRPENVSIVTVGSNTGVLQLTEKTEATPYVCTTCTHPNLPRKFTSGWIETNAQYKYGYFEINCQLPYDNATWPAFWLFGANMPPVCYYNEIDIFEMGGIGYMLNTQIGTNLHSCLNCAPNSAPASIDCYPGGSGALGQNLTCPDYTNGFHTYSVEWLPERITWYIDGKFLRNASNVVGIDYPMQIIANLALIPDYQKDPQGNWYATGSVVANREPVNLTNDMWIDYIKTYNLKWDCNTEINQSGFDESKYEYGVKKSIVLGNTIIPAQSNGAPTNITLRATDMIQLNAGFEVALGAELALMPTECHCTEKITPESSCISNYIFQNNYTYSNGDAVTYQAGNLIEAGGNTHNYELQTGSSVNFKAGNKISLKPGFKVKSGSSFHAEITTCP